MFFRQLPLLLLARFWRTAPNGLLEAVTVRICPPFVDDFIRPVCPLHNPRQPLLDLFRVQFLRLPPCRCAQHSQPGADMAQPLFPGLGVSFARKVLPLAPGKSSFRRSKEGAPSNATIGLVSGGCV